MNLAIDLAVEIINAELPALITFTLAFLAFAIGHATRRYSDFERGLARGITRGHAERDALYAGFDTENPPQIAAALPATPLTDSETTEFIQRFQDALRDAQPPRLLDGRHVPSLTPWLQSTATSTATLMRERKRVVCGQPARTNLGDVRCMAPFGHPGRC